MDPIAAASQFIQRRSSPFNGGRVAIRRYSLGLAAEASTWSDVVAKIDDLDSQVVSIDIFDTVNQRTVLGEANIERLVCEEAAKSNAWPGTADDMFSRRKVAQQAEPSASALRWYELMGARDPEALFNAELALELALARPAPGALAALQAVRASGRHICFTSDMHLPGPSLRTLLEHLDLIEERDDVISSCDHGASKFEGPLFDVVSSQFQGQSIVHVGNNKWADGAMPVAYGISSIYFPTLNPNRYEAAFQDAGIAGGIVAAASRDARVNAERSALASTGASVLGQAMIAFTLWTLQRAREDNLDGIAFAARDGEISFRMAQLLPDELTRGVPFRYLHGNRRSFQLAGVASLGVSDWLEIGLDNPGSGLRRGLHDRPLSASLERLGYEHNGIPNDLSIAVIDANAPLRSDRLGDWTDFLADERVQQQLLKEGASFRAAIISYLSSIDITSGKWAIVDVGWRGESTAMVSSTVSAATGQSPLCLHFGGNGVTPAIERTTRIERFAFDGVERPVPFPGITDAVENLTASGQARATAFHHLEGAQFAQPVFDNGTPLVATPERDTLWAAALDVAARLGETSAFLVPYLADVTILAAPSISVLDAYWNAPSNAEADQLGAFCYETDDAGEAVAPIAIRYRLASLLGPKEQTLRVWRQGSLQLTPAPTRFVLQAAQMLRNWRRAL